MGGALVGRLQWAKPSRRSGYQLAYRGANEITGSVPLGPQGEFGVAGLPPGTYSLVGKSVLSAGRAAPTFWGPWTLSTGDVTSVGTLRVEPMAEIALEVEDLPDATPRLEARILPPHGDLVRSVRLVRSKTMPSRQSAIVRLAPGHYRVGLRGHGVDEVLRALVVKQAGRASAERQRIQLRARTGVSRAVRVDLPWGARRSIWLRAFDVRGRLVYSDNPRDTDFIETTMCLAPGVYRLVATWNDRTAEQSVEFRATANDPVVRLRLNRW